VDQQQRQQRLLLAAADRDHTALVDHLKRSEDVEVHAGPSRLRQEQHEPTGTGTVRQAAVAARLPPFTPL
jgi:hypothetical protein